MYDQPFSTDSTDGGTRLDPVLARSWLLVNGSHADRFEAATRSHADIVVLDNDGPLELAGEALGALLRGNARPDAGPGSRR